ncbi:MAG: hypothetical protein NUV54_00125 [Candidatus Taylorbacteria bacterium]|nr:hypothetical protein [Candidatus Taylorbacteria bacterium]
MKNGNIALDVLRKVAPHMRATCEEIVTALESMEVPADKQVAFCRLFTFTDIQRVSHEGIYGRANQRESVEAILKEKGMIQPAFS